MGQKEKESAKDFEVSEKLYGFKVRRADIHETIRIVKGHEFRLPAAWPKWLPRLIRYDSDA